MQLKAHVSHDFNQMLTADQTSFGSNVITQLTLNAPANFPDLPFTIAQITDANNQLRTRYDAFKLQGPIVKGAYQEAESIWKEIFTRNAEYIDLVADGSVSKINLSGYHITKTEAIPATPPVAPEADMTINNNDRGTVAVKIKGVKNAKGYIYGMVTTDFDIDVNGNQITLKLGNSLATFIISTQREVKFESLPPSEVTAAVAAFNSAGWGEFSAVTEVKIP